MTSYLLQRGFYPTLALRHWLCVTSYVQKPLLFWITK